MDEAAASAMEEDAAGNKDTTSGNSVSPSAEEPADVNQCSIACNDCGLRFTHWGVFKTHLHQHALEEEEEEDEEEEEEDEEDEEEAQTADNMSSAVELDSGKVDDGENTGGGMGGDADGSYMSSSLQTNPPGLTQVVEDATASTRKHLGKIHACLVCGKVYTYLVSFRKHQRLHEKPSTTSTIPESNVQNLSKYQCPECGMSFIRRARLLGHLRVHSSFKSKPPRCDQCNKDFNSVKSWLAHVDLHKQKPFWCSSCGRSFKDEGLLNKHLQSHDLREYTCNICQKSFRIYKQLRIHYNSHTGAKPYKCTFCRMSFSQPGNLIAHRKKHLRVYVGSSGIPLGIKNSANIARKQGIQNNFLLASVKEEREMDTRYKFGHHANPKVSDGGRPAHHFKISKPPGSAGSVPPDEFKSETVQPQTGQELYESESRETNMWREHQYWEWECVECDMGFDEVAKLHLHYIKHATGELPIPQDDDDDDEG